MTTNAQATQPDGSGDKAQGKIKFGEKLSFGLLVMTSNPLLSLITGYLMIFYTNIVGLNPIAIGTLFLLSRIMDGISDPISGYLIDHLPRTKMGKFRYAMIIGTILCCINFLLVWYGPLWAPAGKLAIAYITYLVLGFSYDFMDIPKNSLLPAMTANDKERASLGMVQGFFTVISAMIVSIIAPIILGAGDLSMKAFSTVILIVTGLVLVIGIVGPLGVKERVIPAEDTKHSFKEYMNIIIQRPVVTILIFGIVFGVAIFGGSAVSVYFFTYVMHNLPLAGALAPMQLIGLLPGIFLAGIIMRKLGKKLTVVMFPLALAIFTAIRWIDPTSLPLIYISTIGGGFILGVYTPTGQVVNADIIDYVEYKLHYRSEAALSSMSTFTAKVGNGLAGAIPGWVLGLAGYIANSQQQPAPVINAIIWLTIGIPVIFYVISALIFGIGYNLDKNTLQTVQTVLSEKRAAKLADQK